MIEKEDFEWLVCTKCYTFNHAPYIVDALNGFTMQQTSFPYVCVIIDDASSDGEQAVIEEYLQKHFDLSDKSIDRNEENNDYILTCARHKTNKNCFFAVIFLKYNHYSAKKTKETYFKPWIDNCKYVALCEGDDYWIDAKKLQKQVEFLDNNRDYGMCYSSFNRLFQETGRIENDLFKTNSSQFPSTYSLEEFIFKAGYVAPPSWLARKELRDNLPVDLYGSLDGTFVLFATYLAKSKVYVFNEPMVVYRVLSESASHTKDKSKAYKRLQNLFNTKLKLISVFNLSEDFKNKCSERYYKMSLPFFIANNHSDDVNNAYNEIKNKSIRDHFLFAIYKAKIGGLILRLLYKMRETRNNIVSRYR